MGKAIPLRKSYEFREKFENCLSSSERIKCLEALSEEIKDYLATKPDDIDSLRILSRALRILKKYDKAIQVIESFIHKYPQSMFILYLELAVLYMDNLDFIKALELITFLKEKNSVPKEIKEEAMITEAIIYYNMKDAEALAGLFEKNQRMEELLYKHVPSIADEIISFYKAFIEGKKLLQEKAWLRKALNKLREIYPKNPVYMVVESDYEYPEWKTPKFYILIGYPKLPTRELVRWKLERKKEAFKAIEPIIEDVVTVEIGGRRGC